MILLGAQIELAQDFGEEATSDWPTAVIRTDDDPPLGVAEGVVAPVAADPNETRLLGNPSPPPVASEPRLGYAAVWMCQVSVKSVRSGAFGSATFR